MISRIKVEAHKSAMEQCAGVRDPNEIAVICLNVVIYIYGGAQCVWKRVANWSEVVWLSAAFSAERTINTICVWCDARDV